MRIESLDFLRGFAILLMFVDHVAYLLGEDIETFNIRFLTRLSEPLFALLLGYFLVGRSKEKLLSRFIDILGAAFLVNIIFFPATSRFDILVSFLICYILYFFLGDKLYLLFPAFLLFNFDPTLNILDYPISLVISQVAIGMSLRLGKKPYYLLLAPLSFLLPLYYSITAFFTFFSILFIMLALDNPNFSMKPINLLGKHPLKFYVAQFYLALLLLFLYFYFSDFSTNSVSIWFS